MGCPHCSSVYGLVIDDIAWCEHCEKAELLTMWGAKPKKRRQSYADGTHGAKRSEQKRRKVSGSTHQSEHIIGYKVAAPSLPRGGSAFAKVAENKMPAYQEELLSHREHAGTGSGKESDAYRELQRATLDESGVGAAFQLNQEFYAHQASFRSSDAKRKAALEKADDSFFDMVANTDWASVFEYRPDKNKLKRRRRRFGATEKAEVTLARNVARTGAWPKPSEFAAMEARFNVPTGEKEPLPVVSTATAFSVDKYGVPKDGNCLFQAVVLGLQRKYPGKYDTLGHAALRASVVANLRALRANPAFPDSNLTKAYVDHMAQPRAWGGEYELYAIANVLHVRLTVHNEGGHHTITYGTPGGDSLDIYYDGSVHYSTGPNA